MGRVSLTRCDNENVDQNTKGRDNADLIIPIRRHAKAESSRMPGKMPSSGEKCYLSLLGLATARWREDRSFFLPLTLFLRKKVDDDSDWICGDLQLDRERVDA